MTTSAGFSKNDPIRNELRIAFRRQAGNEKIIVIPCLVNEGKIPSADVLPSDIKKLAGIRAIRLARDTWDKDLDSLAETHPALLRTSTQLQRSWRFWANVVVTPAVIIACLHFLHGQLLPNTGKVFWLFLVTAPTVLLALYHSLWEHIPRATVWLTALAIGFISNILMALSNIPSWSAEHLTQQASAFLIGVTLISLTYLVSTLVIRAIRPRA